MNKIKPLKAFKKEDLGFKDRKANDGDIYILPFKERWYKKTCYIILVLRGEYWIEDKSL